VQSVNAQGGSSWERGEPPLNGHIAKVCAFDFLSDLGKKIINPGGIEGRNQMLELVQPKAGSQVLVIGGGAIYTACHIAQAFHCQVTALDHSLRRVNEAEAWVDRLGLVGQVHCQTGEVTHLPFEDEQFDYVITQAVIMLAPQQQGALSEIRRVLKAKGVFAGLEFCWRRMPGEEVRDATRDTCGCTGLDLHTLYGWIGTLRDARFEAVQATEHPCRAFGATGVIKDEGWINSLRIARRLLLNEADRDRLREIRTHLSRNQGYFSYIVFAGKKLALPKVRAAPPIGTFQVNEQMGSR
jgi:SAM-dependent methyltransferase